MDEERQEHGGPRERRMVEDGYREEESALKGKRWPERRRGKTVDQWLDGVSAAAELGPLGEERAKW